MNLFKELEDIKEKKLVDGEISIIEKNSDTGKYLGLSVVNKKKSRDVQIRFLLNQDIVNIFFYDLVNGERTFSLTHYVLEKSVKLPTDIFKYSSESDVLKIFNVVKDLLDDQMSSIWGSDQWYKPSKKIIEDEVKAYYF